MVAGISNVVDGEHSNLHIGFYCSGEIGRLMGFALSNVRRRLDVL